MKAKALLPFTVLLALSAGVALAQTSSNRKSPTSKFYVAEVTGFAQVDNGEKVEDLVEKSVFDAEASYLLKPSSRAKTSSSAWC